MEGSAEASLHTFFFFYGGVEDVLVPKTSGFLPGNLLEGENAAVDSHKDLFLSNKGSSDKNYLQTFYSSDVFTLKLSRYQLGGLLISSLGYRSRDTGNYRNTLEENLAQDDQGDS